MERESVSFHAAHLRAYFLVPGKSKVGEDIPMPFSMIPLTQNNYCKLVSCPSDS